MDLKLFATVFATVFVAELGDKTQLATVLYAADAEHPKLTVFAGAAAALVLSTALGVAARHPGVSANDITDEGFFDALSGVSCLTGVPVSVTAASV